MDILFHTEQGVFSYRVAGLLIHQDRILLQKPADDDGYAVPGGHSVFGETNEETLKREFKEEMGADIEVGELECAGEVFFPCGDKNCHQICLYYRVRLCGEGQIPRAGRFWGVETIVGRGTDLEFIWVPLSEIKNIKLYPENLKNILLSDKITHFVYREEEGAVHG